LGFLIAMLNSIEGFAPKLRKTKMVKETNPEKFILDACCGGRQIWFQKEQENTIFLDIREVEKGIIKLQPNFCIKPNIIGDYRDLPFPDKSFKLVVWDIPHIMGKKINGIIQTKYGYLDKDNYEEDLKKGFDEIWRILDDYGVLEFKYADINLPIKEILSIFPQQPLFGTITKKGVNNTFWVCFMKIPIANSSTLPNGNPAKQESLICVKEENQK
jgi:hypothetical protein